MKVVELLGSPGSGKSTLAGGLATTLPDAVDLEHAVWEAIQSHGADGLARAIARLARSPRGRLWKSAYAHSGDRLAALTSFMAAHPNLLETVLAVQRQRADRDRGQELVLGWIINLMARYQTATDHGGAGWLIIDEGFCQRAVALLGYRYGDEDRGLLASYLAVVPPPDALVVVEAPLEICTARLDRRGWSERLEGSDAPTRTSFLSSTAVLVREVAAAVESSGTRVIWVDGTTPTPDSVDLVAATLTQ